jgi:hypothetical protein
MENLYLKLANKRMDMVKMGNRENKEVRDIL